MTEKQAIRKPRRSAAQRTRDRQRISTLYLEGWLQCDIADEVGLSQSTVSNDLKILQKQWLSSTLININEAKAKELARIDKLEQEYYQAWHRSCEDAETITEKGKGSKAKAKDDEDNSPTRPTEFEKTVQRKGQAGDPRFLQGVQWCISQRCKILGVNAPKKSEDLTVNLNELTNEQLTRLASGEDLYAVLASGKQ